MSDKDISCRICRTGGSASHPLLHPCKCRGSIKYIHQNCLMEWLKHSNKSTQKCDICNTTYKFRTIYDPGMPRRIPLKYIWNKSVNNFINLSTAILSVMLYISCLLIQVPLYWKFIGRIYTWSIDGFLPESNPTFLSALLFGELDLSKYNLPSDPAKLLFFKIHKFFSYTYLSGVRYILVCIIILIAIFVEHEWIVRDEGYAKTLLKKIGQEPRTKLVDMLQQALNGVRNGGGHAEPNVNANIERLEMMARALNDLRAHPNANHHVHEEALRRVIEGENINAANELNRVDDADVSSSDNENDNDTIGRMEGQQDANSSNNNEEGRNELNNGQEQEEDFDNFGRNDLAEDVVDDDEAVQLANNIGNGDLFDLLGIKLNITTPIFLMFVCDLIVTVFLFITYVLPHMIGNAFVIIAGEIVRLINSQAKTDFIFKIPYVNKVEASVFQNHQALKLVLNTVKVDLITPVTSIFQHFFIDQELGKLTLFERVILLTIGYSFIIFCVRKVMLKLEAGKKPLMGTPRKIYKVLFEMASTSKVFLIFAVEIFFFPVYCGWLLDFCIMPLLSGGFIRKHEGDTTTLALFYTLESTVIKTNYMRLSLYLASGTLYMLLFALFMGMIRGSILRPGVLFFIRSPDDPNARLIHDALMKPLMLQLSRIYLSAKVYTCFIIFGIGSVTWGIRSIVMPNNANYNVLLPIQAAPLLGTFVCGSLISELNKLKPLITKYCKVYWKKAFEISCFKLRLSHFILGRPIAQERGYIVYRNLQELLLGRAIPDYSRPVTYRYAEKLFDENKELKACFVPDGSYVRAPDNDTVSRKFIKKLFVEVTKDDVLLNTPEEETNEETEYLYESSDDEINKEDAYAIVYRPPNFKLRCFGLIGFLWVFSVILIVGVSLISLVLGRQVVSALFIVMDSLTRSPILKSVGLVLFDNFDWRLADVPSICIGFRLLLLGIEYFDSKKSSTSSNTGQNVRAQEANRRDFIAPREGPFEGNRVLFSFPLGLRALTPMFWIVWICSVHKLCVDIPLRFYYGKTEETSDGIMSSIVLTEYLVNKYSILSHLFVSIWTLIPFLMYSFELIKLRVIDEQELIGVWKSGAFKLATKYAMVHLPSVLIMIYTHGGVEFKHFTKEDVCTWFLALVVFICSSGLIETIHFFRKISEEVKNEKYVRGRAIENIDSADDE